MQLLKFLSRHSRQVLLWSLIAGIFSGLANTALLAVINSALKQAGAAPRNIVIAFLLLCATLPLSRFVSELLLNKLGQGALFNLRLDLCRQILAAPLRHLEQLGPARMLAALTDDINNITAAILAIPVVCINVAIVVGCLVYMGLLSWALLALVLLFMAIGIASYQLPVIQAQKLFGRARRDSDAIQNHFRALTHGMKELKIHRSRRQAFMDDILTGTAASLRQNNLKAMRIFIACSSWGQVLVFVVIGLFLFALPSVRYVNAVALTGYTIALIYLMNPLQVIMNTLPVLGRAGIALNTIRQLGFTLAAQGIEEAPEVSATTPGWRSLVLDSVTHIYTREGETENFVLGPVNLSFQPGELVFITGGNGSGKTTLAKLLTGLYVPEEGEVWFDGKPVHTPEEREQYRQHFSTVFSDFFLFEELLGLAGTAVEQEAEKYLAQLKLTHKVAVKNGKLSTTELSQGQRKRLALLTAYLEDRPIYLFDEWAADQDPYFKNIFYLELLPELKARKKTVIVISHDDRYYSVADRIIRLEDGAVVSDGAGAIAQPVLEAV